MQVIGEKVFSFEGFTLDLRRGCLRSGDREVEVRPKSFEVLRYLVENAGRLVSKDELIRAVWLNVVVTDESLTRCVSDVRLALEDHDQRIIKTVPRRGYLFAVLVSQAENESATVSRAPEEARLERPAERRQLTVMACELVGLAALSAQVDPEDLRVVRAAGHGRCTEIIERHRGYVARYSDDGVIAYFGYPDAQEHDAENAVRAGLALVGSAAPIGAGLDAQLRPRIGIASGIVVIGDAAKDRTAVGETPTLSGRLQALAEPGQIVIAHSTQRLVGGRFELRDLGCVALKGLAELSQVWQVLGASAAESRFEADHRAGLTPLVGREEEVELLMRRWRQAKGGEGSVVLLAGEPGIGKSRVAETVLERLSGEPHTRLRIFCSPHHRDTALYPSITQLERAAGFRREDAGAERLEKLAAVLARATKDLGDALPLLAELLSVPIGGRVPPPALTPQKRKEKTLKALVAQLEGLAASQPVLLVVEDAHWADPTSLELFDLIVERAPALPLLLIFTFRPEFAPPWVGRPDVTLLSLNRLPPRQRTEMMTHVTDGKVLPKEIADQIIDRSDGVPLFIEELTKAVVESGLLVASGDRYVATGPVTPLAIPASLQASLLARLDRLGPVREVAQIAAALGRQFTHELISTVAAMPLPQLDNALVQLVRAELVYQRGTPPDAKYTFKHALVQDAAYGTLLRNRRQQLHTRIAATLEEQFPEIVAAQPALLAQHCAEAGLAEKAVVYWLKAGQQAMARSAMTEAVAQLRKGLDVLTGLPDGPWRRQQELDLHIALRPALAATKGWSAPDVGETIARARALAEQIDRPEYLVPLLDGQWGFHVMRSEYKLALSIAEQIEKIGGARNNVAAQLLGRSDNGWTRYRLGEFVAARALLEQCHGLTDPAHRAVGAGLSSDPYAEMLAYLALTLAYLGYIDQGRSRLNEALSEARRLRHTHTQALVLGIATAFMGSLTCSLETQRHAEELLALSTEHGFSFWLDMGTAFRGLSLTALGQAQEGLTLLRQGLTALRATGTVANTPRLLIWLAEAHAKLGQPAEGLNCLAEAAEIIEATEERVDEAELHRLRGDLLNATGDPSAAERSYHQALEVARRQSAKLPELRASISLARLWCGQGKRIEARDLLAPIYNWFTEGFGTPVLEEAKTLLGELAQRARV
jgi:class 3 adenylate cyclase/tetratricopeptide (TPR) repeat protein